jgi:hypothetical protein
MSQIDFHSSFQPAIAPYTPPPPPPPPPEPAPVAAPIQDQNQLQVQTQPPESFDLGALPWDAAVEAPAEAAVAEEVAPKTPSLLENPAFKELSEADQKALTSFLETASEGLEPEAAEALSVQLSQMLNDGKLTATDSFGKRTVDYLSQFNGSGLVKSLGKETTKAEVARDLIKALAEPGKLTQGEGTLDCAEATLEATLAFTKPADYARIAVGLATRGYAPIPGTPRTHSDDYGGPDSLSLPRSFESKGRSPLSALIQASFNEKVQSRSDDDFAFHSFNRGSTGLGANQVALLYDGILGKDHLTVYAQKGVDLSAALKFALGNAPDSVVKVTMKSDTGLHGVAVTGVSDAGVDVWDPATGAITTMPKEEFNNLVVRATLDRSAFLQRSDDQQVRNVQMRANMDEWQRNSGEGYYQSGNDQAEGGGRVASSATKR